MVNLKVLSIFLFLFLLVNCSLSVNGGIVEDYEYEFSNPNETCSTIDYFVYDVPKPTFFDKDNKISTTPTIYSCCLENDSCTTIIFDVYGKNIFTKEGLKEVIDSNFIRYHIFKNDISSLYFINSGLSLCDSIGFGDSKRESLNLAAETVEAGLNLVKSEKVVEIVKTIQVARNLGLINKFNAASLVAGVTCDYDSKKLNLALEESLKFDIYINNLKNGYTYQGNLLEVSNSLERSRILLKEYTESPVAITKGAFDWLINVFKFLFGFATNPQSTHEIAKTDYQLASESMSKASTYNSYLSNPLKESMAEDAENRITLKNNQFLLVYAVVVKQHDELKKIKPSNILINNLFYEPNYNLTEGDNCFDNADQIKATAEVYYRDLKMNSGIRVLNNYSNSYLCAREVYERENLIEREIDGFSLIFSIILVILILYLLKRLLFF